MYHFVVSAQPFIVSNLESLEIGHRRFPDDVIIFILRCNNTGAVICHISHYRDVLMSAIMPQITSMMTSSGPRIIPLLARMGEIWMFLVNSNLGSTFFVFNILLHSTAISIIYSSAFSAFTLDFFPVIQHSFPFNKMVVPSQTIQFRVYSIMRDFQHMFCDRFMHTSALKYDNGLVPCRQQDILISNCDPCHLCIQMSWEK